MSKDPCSPGEPPERTGAETLAGRREGPDPEVRTTEEATAGRSGRLAREFEVIGRLAVSPALAEGRVEDLARELTESASGALDVKRVGVWLFDEDETVLRCVDTYRASDRSHTSGEVLRENEFRNEFSALKTSQFVAADDPLADPRTAGYVEGYLRPNRITAMLDAVVRTRGRNLGVVCLEHVDRPHRWEADEIAFACQLAGQVALAVGERDRRILEDQLLQAQKMESVGRLAGGVAHDINNFLGVILGNAELAAGQVPPGSPAWTHLQEILAATNRSAEIVRQLLAFARRQTARPRVLDLNRTVEATLRMLRRLVPEDVALDWTPAEGLWRIRMDPSQVDQIVANLVVNARDALLDAAVERRIVVETRNAVLRAAAGAGTTDRTPGEYAVLAVRDNGPGLSAQAREHAFEPFFTTKGPGRGTGLGLSTVYGIARQNGGFARVQSEPGRGACFEVYLPRSREAEEELREAPMAARGGAETILLVEDHAMVRRAGTRMLESLGYRVLGAAGPEEALRAAESHAGPIDLVLTDVVMPMMNGVELVRRLRQRRPGLRHLFMSGYTENVIADRQVLKTGVLLLEKPFGLERLDAMVRRALAAEPSSD